MVLHWRISCRKTCTYIFPCHFYCITVFSGGGFGLVWHFKDKSGIFCVKNSSLRCLHFGQLIKKSDFPSEFCNSAGIPILVSFLCGKQQFRWAVSDHWLNALWLMIPIDIPPPLRDPCAEPYLSQAAPLWPGRTLASPRWTPSAQTADSTHRCPAARRRPAPSPLSGGCGAEGSRSRPLPASRPPPPPLPEACTPQRARGNSGTRWPERDRADNLAPPQQ